MTLTAQPPVAAAPTWQFFDASVAAVRRLGPSFVRLTLTGPELAGFGAAGCDQRFKLVRVKRKTPSNTSKSFMGTRISTTNTTSFRKLHGLRC